MKQSLAVSSMILLAVAGCNQPQPIQAASPTPSIIVPSQPKQTSTKIHRYASRFPILLGMNVAQVQDVLGHPSRITPHGAEYKVMYYENQPFKNYTINVGFSSPRTVYGFNHSSDNEKNVRYVTVQYMPQTSLLLPAKILLPQEVLEAEPTGFYYDGNSAKYFEFHLGSRYFVLNLGMRADPFIEHNGEVSNDFTQKKTYSLSPEFNWRNEPVYGFSECNDSDYPNSKLSFDDRTVFAKVEIKR